jgi:hypothetical protein
MNPDTHIEGLYDPNAPFNQEEDDDFLCLEDALHSEIDDLKLELKRLKYAYNCKRKSVEILVDNIDHLESHTYVKNILKDLFL